MGCPHLHGLLLLTTQASAGLCRYSIPDGPPQPLHPDDAALLAVRGTAAAAAARCQAAQVLELELQSWLILMASLPALAVLATHRQMRKRAPSRRAYVARPARCPG